MKGIMSADGGGERDETVFFRECGDDRGRLIARSSGSQMSGHKDSQGTDSGESRLSQDGYPDMIADRAIEYVSSYHYIDDDRYALNYVRQMSGRRSRRQIESDLMKKGLDRDQIRTAFEELAQERMPGEEMEDPDVAAIRSIAGKRGFDPETADGETSWKFVRYLLRRGFGYSSVRQALGSLLIHSGQEYHGICPADREL